MTSSRKLWPPGRAPQIQTGPTAPSQHHSPPPRLHGCQRLAAVALLHADMDGEALAVSVLALALLLGGDGAGRRGLVGEWICRKAAGWEVGQPA